MWQLLGDVPNLVEPFFGSGAVLLARPDSHEWWDRIETANDKDGMVSNFFRALQHDPEQVAHWADWPVNENDLTARHLWLVQRKADLVARLEGDPDYYDCKVAGYWCWGMSIWIGSGFCSGAGPWQSIDGKLAKAEEGEGINRRLPHLGNAGEGINRKRPHLGGAYSAGCGINRTTIDDLYAYFAKLANRLRRVRVCCGDWERVCGFTPTSTLGLTGVYLDPPYSHSERDSSIYAVEMETTERVREWAISRGDDPLMRICLSGYSGEHDMPEGWVAYPWTAHGGYGLQGNGRGRENREREVVWANRHCLPLERQGQLSLFEESG